MLINIMATHETVLHLISCYSILVSCSQLNLFVEVSYRVYNACLYTWQAHFNICMQALNNDRDIYTTVIHAVYRITIVQFLSLIVFLEHQIAI